MTRKKAGARKKRPPVTRTPELEERILQRIAAGDGLRKVCEDADMPDASTVRYWAVTDPDFGERMRLARMVQAHEMVDLMLEELGRAPEYDDNGRVDNGDVSLRKLRVDTYKWTLVRVLPRLYGDKLTLAGDPEAPLGAMSDKEVLGEVLSLLGRAKQRQLSATHRMNGGSLN